MITQGEDVKSVPRQNQIECATLLCVPVQAGSNPAPLIYCQVNSAGHHTGLDRSLMCMACLFPGEHKSEMQKPPYQVSTTAFCRESFLLLPREGKACGKKRQVSGRTEEFNSNYECWVFGSTTRSSPYIFQRGETKWEC